MTKPTRALSPLSIIAAILLSLASIQGAFALGEENYVSPSASAGSFPLAGANTLAPIYIDSADHWGAIRTAGDLATDIERVTGRKPEIVNNKKALGKRPVIIGTIGKSALIDELIAKGKIDVSKIQGKWDAYHIEVVDRPIKGIRQALVVVGADKRGTIYGTYDISEKIGVSPWHFWADVPTRTSDELHIAGNLLIEDAPKVKYRGIFLNDEAPALSGYVRDTYGNFNSEFYVTVFELLLRMKSNFLWPAMWNNAFADDDEQNMILADKYGIVMSTSHHEPMMRADKEWDRYGEGAWDFDRNPDKLHDFWVDGVTRNKDYESIYTVGMRGQQDTPMSETENIGLLEAIVADQREILTEVFDDRDIDEVPQVWALYKEVQGYYERGMRVPDDVILLWCDDNWGNIRRLPTAEERKRVGGAGVYYHFDYVGGPRSYRWMNVIQLAKIWEQMNLADKYGANKIWLTNVGDLKPMEYPIEYFLDLAWDIDDWPKERIHEYGQLWAAREFGEEYAVEIEQLMSAYTRHNGRRKPELQDANTYSLQNYREAERIEAELEDLATRAQSIYDQLDDEYKDAYFELVLYPVTASGIITRMYIAQGRNQLYASQGRAATNETAKAVETLFAANAEWQNRYHTEIANGKWNHIMSQPRIGYTHWNNPPADTMPSISTNVPNDVPDMGVVAEGSTTAWPQDGARNLLVFYQYGQAERYIDVFNKGTVPFDYAVAANDPWVKVSHTEGKLENDIRVSISIDWDKVPDDGATSSVGVRGTGWGGARVGIIAVKQASEVKGFVEADGYISIEAANFSSKHDSDGYSWQEIPNHGRTQSSVSVFPITDRSFENPSEAPFIEYDLTTLSQGEFTIEALFAPTWPVNPERGIRYAIAFDDQTPQIIDVLANNQNSDWQESVRNGVRKSSSTHTLNTAGHHTLRIYMVDPAATLQKIVINTGGLKESYLGPEESYLAM